MPAEPPPSLESLARAAVAAWVSWQRWPDAVDVRDTFDEAMHALDVHFRRVPDPPPPRAAGSPTPVQRLQVELHFACALIADDGAPIDEPQRLALIAEARHLARLLLDGPDAR